MGINRLKITEPLLMTLVCMVYKKVIMSSIHCRAKRIPPDRLAKSGKSC